MSNSSLHRNLFKLFCACCPLALGKILFFQPAISHYLYLELQEMWDIQLPHSFCALLWIIETCLSHLRETVSTGSVHKHSSRSRSQTAACGHVEAPAVQRGSIKESEIGGMTAAERLCQDCDAFITGLSLNCRRRYRLLVLHLCIRECASVVRACAKV